MQMERFWYKIATYMINLYVDRELFSLTEFVSVNLVGHCREYIKETCNLHDEFEEIEIDHVGPRGTTPSKIAYEISNHHDF